MGRLRVTLSWPWNFHPPEQGDPVAWGPSLPPQELVQKEVLPFCLVSSSSQKKSVKLAFSHILFSGVNKVEEVTIGGKFGGKPICWWIKDNYISMQLVSVFR